MKPPEEIVEVDWRKEDAHVTLEIGQKCKLMFHRHGSVGEDAEMEVKDSSILKHSQTDCEYLHPEHMKNPEWTGGDAERCYWLFEAIKKGETTITVRILFRFDVDSEHIVSVVVV